MYCIVIRWHMTTSVRDHLIKRSISLKWPTTDKPINSFDGLTRTNAEAYRSKMMILFIGDDNMAGKAFMVWGPVGQFRYSL